MCVFRANYLFANSCQVSPNTGSLYLFSGGLLTSNEVCQGYSRMGECKAIISKRQMEERQGGASIRPFPWWQAEASSEDDHGQAHVLTPCSHSLMIFCRQLCICGVGHAGGLCISRYLTQLYMEAWNLPNMKQRVNGGLWACSPGLCVLSNKMPHLITKALLGPLLPLTLSKLWVGGTVLFWGDWVMGWCWRCSDISNLLLKYLNPYSRES